MREYAYSAGVSVELQERAIVLFSVGRSAGQYCPSYQLIKKFD